MASPVAVQAYVAQTVARLPLGEILAQRLFDSDGRYVRNVTPAPILTAVADMVEHPDYSAVHVPVLSINAVAETASQLMPRYASAGAEARAVFNRIFAIWRPVADAQRTAFRSAMPTAAVVDIRGASHYLFISHRDEVVNTVRTFLAAHRERPL